MRLLLDSHVLLAVMEPHIAVLPAGIRSLLAAPTNEYVVSVASLWEIAIKWRLGKLKLTTAPAALPELLSGLGLQLLAINAAHALAELDPMPPTRDPFDRLLLAQCQIEGLNFVTLDRALAGHPLALRI